MAKTKKRGYSPPPKAERDEELRQEQESELQERLSDFEGRVPENPPESVNARTASLADAEKAREQAQKDHFANLRDAAQHLPAGVQPAKAPAGHKGGEFVLLAGTFDDLTTGEHYEYDKNKETTVNSELDLDVLFANKFRRVDGPTRQSRDYHEPFNRGNFDPSLAERVPQGVVANLVGEVENPTDAQRQTLAELRAPKKASAAKAAQEEEEDEAEESELGEDVTGKFEGAEDAGLMVFKDGKNYFVADKDAPGDALNRKPLRRDGVAGFVEKQAAEKE
jgi:hypothetical protein